jgi:hypothetical protein
VQCKQRNLRVGAKRTALEAAAVREPSYSFVLEGGHRLCAGQANELGPAAAVASMNRAEAGYPVWTSGLPPLPNVFQDPLHLVAAFFKKCEQGQDGGAQDNAANPPYPRLRAVNGRVPNLREYDQE